MPASKSMMNQAKIVKLARPADTIVVGNPAIADASVQDASTIVLTGKGFGVTNLVVLDQDGNPIIDEQVTVVRQTASPCAIYRRAEIQTNVLHALLRELVQERRRADFGSGDERRPVGSARQLPRTTARSWLAPVKTALTILTAIQTGPQRVWLGSPDTASGSAGTRDEHRQPNRTSEAAARAARSLLRRFSATGAAARPSNSRCWPCLSRCWSSPSSKAASRSPAQQVMANATDDVARQMRTGQIKADRPHRGQLKKLICDQLEIMVAKGLPRARRSICRNSRHFRRRRRGADQAHRHRMKGHRHDRLRRHAGRALTKNMLRVFYRWPVMTDFMRKRDVEAEGRQDAAFRDRDLAERTVRRLTQIDARREAGKGKTMSQRAGAHGNFGQFGRRSPGCCRDRRGVAAIEFALDGAAAAVHVFRDNGGRAGDRNQQEGRPRRQHGRRPGDPAARRSPWPNSRRSCRSAKRLLQPYNRPSPTIIVTAIEITNDAPPKAKVFWSRKLSTAPSARPNSLRRRSVREFRLR